MDLANVMSLLLTGAGPIASTWLLVRFHRVDWVIVGLAITTGLASIPAFFYAFTAYAEYRSKLAVAWREVIRYATPRAPGGLSFAGLMAIGPYLAGGISIRSAGFLVISQSLVTITEAGTDAFGLVALPKVASLSADSNSREILKNRIADLTSLIVHIGLFFTIQLLLWSDQIVLLWLGPKYLDAITTVRIMLMAVVPYLGYSMLRSIVDAVDTRAINARHTYIALLVTLVLSLGAILARWGLSGLAVANAVGIAVLGGATIRFLWRSYRPTDYSLKVAHFVGANTVVLASSLGLRLLFGRFFSGAVLLTIGVGWASALFALYLLYLRRIDVRWVREAEQRIFRRTAG